MSDSDIFESTAKRHTCGLGVHICTCLWVGQGYRVCYFSFSLSKGFLYATLPAEDHIHVSSRASAHLPKLQYNTVEDQSWCSVGYPLSDQHVGDEDIQSPLNYFAPNLHYACNLKSEIIFSYLMMFFA